MLSFHYDIKRADVRVHGNGFIQAELADGSKLHIWTKDCPRQEVPTLIHNHTSAFSSTILFGVLRNEEYELGKAKHAVGDIQLYEMYEAVKRKKKDTGLVSMNKQRFLSSTRKFYFAAGTTYQFPGTEDLFHATYPETDLVVTRVFRQPEQNRNPIVLVPIGEKPDNTFDRYEHKEYAEEVYQKVKMMLRAGKSLL
jgi:hypothetical protein